MTINVLIYGAGEAGKQIATYCKQENTYKLVGFIDDNPSLWGESIEGVMIFTPKNITSLIEDYLVSEIFIAIPSARRERYQAILRHLNRHHIHLRTLPSINEIDDGKVGISDIREINVEDLLLRPPVEPINGLLAKNIERKVVMVTGAGGSIGSELCRQIIRLLPKKIILIDHSEFNLFQISTELQSIAKKINIPNASIISILESVADEQLIRSSIIKHNPETIFHAAAYKHVGIVENNICAAVKNNILGTLHLAKVSYEFGVKNFVLISTDKAVRPTSIMGLTKRVSELILQSLASIDFKERHHHHTCFSMVRFGNVLGSSGSVVPIFRGQINKGGPVTVTHPEVTRYFMTISEAAQLVIQASSLAKGGDLFLLDMGEPIKIFDLAKNMIELSGLTVKNTQFPEGDIEIQFIGLGKGEKLSEEILISGVASKTIHPKIQVTHEDFLSWSELESALAVMNHSLLNVKDIINILKHLVPSYCETKQ